MKKRREQEGGGDREKGKWKIKDMHEAEAFDKARYRVI